MAQGLGRPRGPASHVPSGFSLHVTVQAAKSATSPRLSPLLVSLAQSTEHPGNSRGVMGHLLRHPAKSKGDVIRSPRSPRFSLLLVSLAQSTEHPGNSRGLMGHLLRHPAKSKGDVIRSPRSPRSSPL